MTPDAPPDAQPIYALQYSPVLPLATWRLRCFWMLVGVLTAQFASSLASVAGDLCMLAGMRLTATPSLVGFASSGVHVLTFCALALVAVLVLCKLGPAAEASRGKWVVGLVVLVVVLVLFSMANFATQFLMTRMAGPGGYAQLRMSSGLVHAAWSLLQPVLLALAAIVVRPRT